MAGGVNQLPGSPLKTADLELAGRIAHDDHDAFETLMRRNNSRLFRVARAVLKNDADAEDCLQEAYLQAYRNMASFQGTANLTTWLTRIVVNEALMRLRRDRRHGVVVPFEPRGEHVDDPETTVADEKQESPPSATLRHEIRHIVERRVDQLPLVFRTVFIMRDVEDMSVQETAEALGIPAPTVRTRLFRARALLREALARDIDSASVDVFGFAGERCNRIVEVVLSRVRLPQGRG
jgi:RNA polymerase sigma-70 factor (ECF subfamily)